MNSKTAALAAEIVRCPVVDQCLAPGGEGSPCHRVVSWQGQTAGGLRYVPEPWSGHLDRASILFVGSNPGADVEGAPISDTSFTAAWETDEIVSCYDDAFEPWRKPGIVDGVYQSDKYGNRAAKPIRYWMWARARARELLQREPAPGVDYALTEVVHCGTQHEAGVDAAFGTCTDRYFERTLRASPAAVVVCVGSWAKAGFKRTFNIDVLDHFWGPAEVAGRRRFILAVPHPGAYGSPKRFEPYIGTDGLARTRALLETVASG
jgi:uracil-DNA glycosylase